MNSDAFQRAAEIFLKVRALPPEQRQVYLAEVCGADAELLKSVSRLLQGQNLPTPFETLADQFVQAREQFAPTGGDSAAHPGELKAGDRIGKYTLLEVIGEGGFGTVYLAEQSLPVQRRVALKVIKLGMDSKQVIARFEAERQALAMMDHPGIAKVFDAGTTDGGRPYFVMEFVQGIPVTSYCDANRLSAVKRLELVILICRAVQHAHQKGIIHRDLKPSNVLVNVQDGKPAVKVIDFGIAKATQARLTEKTIFTEFSQLIGTPEYMSPEQAEMGGIDLDTRSDVYSLGVILYELLIGATPFDPRDLRSKAFAEMQRVIREVEPPTPSDRLSKLESLPSIAAQRGVEPRKLGALIRGELDWIIMKCLEKDRTRRYDSASALADDIERHLADESVSVSPPSRVYRARKFVRRHRAGAMGALLIALLLIAGISGTTVGLLEARKQRDAAKQQSQLVTQQAAITEAVSQFQSDMLSSADPNKLLGDKVTVLEAVSAAVKELDQGRLKDQPLVEAKVRDTIGNTLRDLGRFDLAVPNLRKSLDLRRQNLAPGSRPIAQSMENLALLLQWQSAYAESETMHREALGIFRVLDPPDEENAATALNNLGWLMTVQGKHAEAEQFVREALVIYRRILPADHAFIPLCLSNIAHALIGQEKFAEAEPVSIEAMNALRKRLPAGHPNIAAALTGVAGVLARQGKYAEAEPYSREALEVFRASHPADHPNVGTAANSLGVVLRELERFAEAEALLREALKIRRKSLPPTHLDITRSLHNLALVLSSQEKFSDAEPVFREAIAAAENASPKDDLLVAHFRMSHGNVLARWKRYAESETELLEAQRIFAAAKVAPGNRLTEVAESLKTLYDLWDKSEPGKGHDLKSQKWREMLPPGRASTTSPSSAPTK